MSLVLICSLREGANYFLARGSSTQESKDLLVSALPDVPTIHPALIFPDEFVSSSVSIHLTRIWRVYSREPPAAAVQWLKPNNEILSVNHITPLPAFLLNQPALRTYRIAAD